MKKSFRHTLLITLIFLLFSCKSEYNKSIFQARNVIVSSESTTLDSNIVRLYQPYKEKLDKDMNRVISVSQITMEKDKPESLLTNFLGDLLLTEGQKVSKEKKLGFTPDVSFFNYGGIRISSLPKGEITVGKAFELMPFENLMVFVKIKGSKMKAFMDYIANHGGGSIGGAKIVISNKKAKKIKIGEKIFNPEASYWVVTNDYVAGGGDGLNAFKNYLAYINSEVKIRDAIISYMEEQQKNNKQLTAKLDRRICYDE